MIRKDQRPFCFTDWQVKLLKQTHHSVRQLNRAALNELRDVGRTTLTHAQYQAWAERVATIAIRLASAIRVRHDILASGREETPQRILFTFSLYCENCDQNGHLENRDSDDEDASHEGNQDPAYEPGYEKAVEDLLELVLRTEERVSARCNSLRAPPRALFLAISRLTSMVLRQQQLLRSTTLKRAPEFEIIDTDICPQCNSRPEDEPELD
jgi:hypothetical protein